MVAALQGTEGQGYRFRLDLLHTAVQNVFTCFEEKSEEQPSIDNILFPLIDAGLVEVSAFEISLKLLTSLGPVMQQVESCRTAYILARTKSELEALNQAALRTGLIQVEP